MQKIIYVWMDILIFFPIPKHTIKYKQLDVYCTICPNNNRNDFSNLFGSGYLYTIYLLLIDLWQYCESNLTKFVSSNKIYNALSDSCLKFLYIIKHKSGLNFSESIPLQQYINYLFLLFFPVIFRANSFTFYKRKYKKLQNNNFSSIRFFFTFSLIHKLWFILFYFTICMSPLYNTNNTQLYNIHIFFMLYYICKSIWKMV